MSDANKAFEAIRIMMQANPTEESIALWSKIGKLTKEAIENALAELKKFAATVKGTDQYPLLQAEIKRTEEELKKLYAQEVKPSVKLSGLEELLEQNKKILRPAVFNNLAKKELMASLKGFTFEAESTNENGDLVKHEALVSDSLTQLKTEKTIYEALANCLLK
jgi:molecular chaperone DnaK (HSP70)